MTSEQADKLIAMLERVATQLERAAPWYEQRWPQQYPNQIPAAMPIGCACPAGHVCMNIACPRRIVAWQTTSKAEIVS